MSAVVEPVDPRLEPVEWWPRRARLRLVARQGLPVPKKRRYQELEHPPVLASLSPYVVFDEVPEQLVPRREVEDAAGYLQALAGLLRALR